MEVILMLYIGVDIKVNCSALSALSEGFALIDELLLFGNDFAPLRSWLDSLSMGEMEPVLWFFCEKKFYRESDSKFFVDFRKDNHQFFLVKDRAVKNLIKICRDLFAYQRSFTDFDVSRLLAASRGLFNDSLFYLYAD